MLCCAVPLGCFSLLQVAAQHFAGRQLSSLHLCCRHCMHAYMHDGMLRGCRSYLLSTLALVACSLPASA